MKPLAESQSQLISIAIVGAGPTAIYTIQTFLRESNVPFRLKVFEQQGSAGRGTPYRPGWNDPAMLSNIPSVELPAIGKPLVNWLKAQPAEKLSRFGVDHDMINDRAFYPRLLLGDYMKEGFDKLLVEARKRGIDIQVCTGCLVKDVVTSKEGVTLEVKEKGKSRTSQKFDYVVLATGHQWPEHPEIRPGYFASPWPASALAKIGPTAVGIRGSSLTAIDAVVALATRHGSFEDRSAGQIFYKPTAGSEEFRMTMMSRKGLLPEADFYGAIPYEPLEICTPETIRTLTEGENTQLLDGAFDLFKQQLAFSDPEYAAKIGLGRLSLENFHDLYFRERLEHDVFEWSKKNLQEAEKNYKSKVTVPWRYAILRMHEVIEPLIPYLENEEYERFTRYFKPVFIDDYATIPHLSIKRILALHEAGKLELLELGDDYRIDSSTPQTGAIIVVNGDRYHFPAFIDATGQRGLSAKDFPFPSLVKQGDINDVVSAGEGPKRGIAIDDQFHPVSRSGPDDRLFCLSLPFILGTHPFHQGLTSAHEMGEEVGREISKVFSKKKLCHEAVRNYIGGEHEHANIEVHDMRFVVANTLEETFDELRRQWWGKPKSLHIDCWAEIDSVDGYQVSLEPEPFAGPERLYYVNLGGYDRSEFIEKHKNAFVVAETAPDARKKAISQVKSLWYAPHRDEQYEAEQAFALDSHANEAQLHIHLNENPRSGPLAFTCKYYPIRQTAQMP